MELKLIPPITWRNLIPPNFDHDYFRSSQRLPFETHSAKFSLVNAWWLSEASLLAYADPDFALPRFKAAGFGRARFFSAHTTQCYLVEADRFRVLVFRGTQSDLFQGKGAVVHFLADLRADLDARLVENLEGVGVHRGFRIALDEVWPQLLPCLSAANDRPLWMTGHSLGGALATLAAWRFAAVHGLYTFGSPKVGNRAFMERFHIPAYRFVHHRDGVPALPPAPYRHVGQLYYLDGRGKIVFTVQGRPVARRAGGLRQWRGQLLQWLASREAGASTAALLPRFLRDHMPILYTLHIWNNLIDPLPDTI